MAFPKDTRQRMINLMYLVLMAMLALNIDPAALKAFKNINEGMKISFGAFDSKNSATADAIAAKASEEGGFATEYSERAKLANEASGKFQSYIDDLIKEVRENSLGANGEYTDNDKDAADLIMITDNPDTGKAAELKGKINEAIEEFKATLTGAQFFEEEEINSIVENFALKAAPDGVIDDPDNIDGYNWEKWNFKGKPAIALEAILRQIKNNATATEGQILDEFRSRLDIGKIDYDIFKVAVIPSSTYLQQGDKFTADIYLASTSSQSKGMVKIFANGQSLNVDDEGKATYSASNSVGEHSVDGYITVTNPDTGVQTRVDFDKPVKYQVAAPSATVAADKMNVLYIGVPNPLTVSAAGVPLDQVKASCTGCGSFSPNGAGKYTAKPTAQGKATVSITANGKNMGSSEFRVKRIPDPVPMIGTRKSGTAISTGELAAQTYLRAVLDGFDFDAKFDVLSYNVMLAAPGKAAWRGTNSGPRFNGEVRNALSKARPGFYVFFTDIKAKGPDGTTRDIGAANYVVR